MAKPKQIWKRFKGSIMVLLAAIAALVAAITSTDIDDKLCAKWDKCEAAFESGQAGNEDVQ